MRRNPFLIFAMIMALVIGSAVSFIQSSQFAHMFKTTIARYLPSDMGIQGDFSEFEVKIFPPGVSIHHPHLRLLEHNVAGLPPGSAVSAERIDLTFRPVQMFSGNIRVHEVSVVKGDVNLLLGDPKSKKQPKKNLKPSFHWDELFQVHAEAISASDTHFHIVSVNPELSADFIADSLRVGQWNGKGPLGYELDLELSAIQSSLFKSLPALGKMDRLRLAAHVNAQGFQLESLQIRASSLDAEASGVIKGNVLEPKSLIMDAAFSLKGDVEKFAKLIPGKSLPPASGLIEFKGKARGVLDRLMETLKVEGVLDGRGIHFDQWNAESLHAEMAWNAGPKGGELSLSKATISSPERARTAAPANGGKIEVGAFKVNFAAPSFSVPLNLERAHLHWLAAPVISKVFKINLRATGPVNLAFHPPVGKLPWELEAKVGLDVQDFQLDNQHLGKTKTLHKVVAVSKVRLEAVVVIDPRQVRAVKLAVGTGTTRLEGSGKVDFKSGLDLSFNGPINLEDIGQIAENEIRGKGVVTAHVHGPFSNLFLDFDPDLKDASYLHLKFGQLKGRISWDDDRNRIVLTHIQAQRGDTRYQGEGVIDLDHDKDTIALDVHVPSGLIQDLIPVFDNLTSDIWWFPKELTGAVRGDVQISGGVSMDRLVIDAKLIGHDWEEWGERFNTVNLQGGYDKGKFQLTEFKGLKRQGIVYGRISRDRDNLIDWGFHTEDFTVGDFDHFAALDVPIRGRLTIESAGKGKDGAIKSYSQATLDNVAVRGSPMPSSQLEIRTENGQANIKGVALGGQGTLDAVYDSNPGSMSTLRGELKRLDFSPILLLINPKLIQDRAVTGDISGAVSLSFQAGQFERASGQIEVSAYHLAKSGAQFALSSPVAFKVSDGTFDLKNISLRGNQSEATLSLQGNHARLEGSVAGDIDVSVAEFFTPTLSKATGTASLDFALGGTIKEPTIFGKASFDGLSLRIPALESPFENVSGTLQLRQNRLSVENVQGDLAGGRVSAEGSLLLFADRYPTIALKGNLSGNKIKVFPFQYIKVHGDVEVHGDKLPYRVDGNVVVDSALSKEKVFSQKKGETLKALQYTPPPNKNLSSDYPKFKLNIGVVADGGMLIQNDLFDVETKGRFTVVNTLEAPRLLGSAELISGKMLFKDRNFVIQSANALFDSPTVLNPSFTLAASTDINGTKIQVYVSGRLDKLSIELSSNPVMPEPEILSLLAVGVTSNDARRFSATDRSVFEQGEAASLLLHSLDFNREVQDKTGLQIQLDESVAPQQQGQSVFKPQGSTDSIAQPKIVIKRQIGKRFDLSYGTTVGGANSTGSKEVNAEYHFTPGFSVLGVWDNYETIDTQERTSMGLDLKFQTRFK